MPESVYKVIELVGTSTKSWDAATAAAVKLAAKSLRDLRVAEVTQLDVHILENGSLVYRAKLKVSFKYDSGGGDGPPPSSPSPAPKAKRAPKKAPPAPEPEEDEPAPAKKAPRKKKKG